MNIGIYIRTLADRSPASVRFQETILDGLQQARTSKFKFIVFSDVIPPQFKNSSQISFVALARPTRAEVRARRLKLLVGGIARRVLRSIGRGSSPAYERVTQWLAYEPAYFEQLRELNIRLIWNLGIDVLPSFVPSVMVVWDSNYRIHSLFPEYSYVTDGYRFFDKSTPLLQSASYVIVGTEQGKREVVEIFGVYASKVRVIPFPTPVLPSGGHELAEQPSRPYIFYPARFWPHKNHIVLVHALRLLRERHGMVTRCVLSGIDNGNLDYVMRVADSVGVREQIEYLGNVSLDRLADLYQNAAALVYCSAVGPDNFPPLEAMSVGCPVITADVAGAREQYGDAAMFFGPTDEAELADCIWRLTNDPVLREGLIQGGLRRARRWTATDYARSMIDILDEFALLARTWEGCHFKANTSA